MAELDHVVINTLTEMDAAADLFAALGFLLTPRGHHSLGSINHLMMTEGAYLELVGVPETGLQRQEVLDSPTGLNGLVLKTGDADATAAALATAGFAPQGPVAFSRPVALDGRQEEARFRTVRLPPGTFPGGRVYFCQHLTPDLVWRPEWLLHPNGFCGIDLFRIESPEPEAQAALFARAFGAPAERNGADWRVPLTAAEIHVAPGSAARFATARLLFSDLDEIARRAGAHAEATWDQQGPAEGRLSIPRLNVNLICRSRR
ncbi:VOC family protein [Xanthobacter dioxanivorans]|uniref:VOC family protein n=1 Tax=Xanthobacter dioxanivorans TaxID=2528964 RepID=UPI001E2E3098|nr:VOC family protein [Xanthobacter dioxanivorans]